MKKTKRTVCVSLFLVLALALGGCGKRRQVDLEALGWQEDWTNLDGMLAVEPVEGFDLGQNNDALAPSGIWVAAWHAGEGEPYTNSDGKDTTLYDAEIYLLIEECRSEAAAQAELQTLENRERENYDCGEKTSSDYAGQEFGVFSMTNPDAENPYARGAAALGARGKYVLTVELLCKADFDGDPGELLRDFLALIHYNGEVM